MLKPEILFSAIILRNLKFIIQYLKVTHMFQQSTPCTTLNTIANIAPNLISGSGLDPTGIAYFYTSIKK